MLSRSICRHEIFNRSKMITNNFLFNNKISLKFIISNQKEKRMEKTSKEQQSYQNLIKDLNINDKNIPEVPPQSFRTLTFGGRIRIASLICQEPERWVDQTITVGGWVKTLRDAEGGNLIFIELNDGSTIKNLQVVVNNTVNNFDSLTKEGIGSSLQLRGKVVKSIGKEQPVRSI